ncbi:hypothetical protein [Natrinema versiforme]|uniref:Uncharacterized protein n=1 Tax=Natrinema versiforme JCM 10478 TaxID=1227496 RepID=L9Y5L1_9EURY|nr:hypothetical protein [Natrinema versiforme]ELY68936.1 hypothetical protein C489_06203 [Natrinema versiforme JCM 10478]
MVELRSAAIGGVVFLVALYLAYRLLLAFTSLGETEYDEQGTNDRLEMDRSERHRRVGFRHRVSRQTPMVKAFIGAIAVLAVYLAIVFYQVAATGSPSEVAYAGYAEYAVYGMVCVAGGIWFKAKQNGKAGELQVMLEQEDGNKRKTVPFDRSKQQLTDDGTTLVAELKAGQVFGLFWRPKLVGDDAKRRDADHRLPDDLVMWEVPNDESAVWDDRSGEVTVRAKNIREVDNPNRVADYEIVPSERKSRSEIQQLENEKRELEDELRSEKIHTAILSEQLSEIEDILTNEEDAGMRKIRQAKDVLEPDRPSNRPRDYDESDREPTPADD